MDKVQDEIEFSPEKIESQEFTRKGRKGLYDPDEVRSYLRRVSGVVKQLAYDAQDAAAEASEARDALVEAKNKRSDEPSYTDLTEHAAGFIQNAQQMADEIKASAEAEAEAMRQQSLEERKAQQEAVEANLSLMRQEIELEAADLRRKTEEDCIQMRTEGSNELENARQEAVRIVEDQQRQAAGIVSAAQVEAEELLSQTHRESENMRIQAESGFSAQKEEAEQYAASKIQEGDDYLNQMQQEADSYVALKRQEGDEYVAARQGEVYKDAEEAERERDKALQRIADARLQVDQLLEQARAQSEFLRQEAEEVIRAKIRANIDSAERRIARLRITEQAYRERIVAAQTELSNAIVKIDGQSSEELTEGMSDQVIAEAQQRLVESGRGGEDLPAFEDVIDLDLASDEDTVIIDGAPPEMIDVSEASVVEDDDNKLAGLLKSAIAEVNTSEEEAAEG